MAIVNILDTAHLCNIDIDSKTLGHIEVRANCPFCGDINRHLYINTVTNIYHCQRCKAGGNSVNLYAGVKNIFDNRTAFCELSKSLSIHISPTWEPVTATIRQYELQPLLMRHNVYSYFLSLLKLSAPHRRNLRLRGLPDNVIARNQYKTVPLNAKLRAYIISMLSRRYDLCGIPGFYFNEDTQMWMMTARAGFFVPVRSQDGLIQGMQIRLDDESDCKYRWFSSSKKDNGCTASVWIHTVGNTNSHVLCITEGALKADIASYLSGGALFVAVPGINALNELDKTLDSFTVKRIFECIDMDKLTNEYVKTGLERIGQIARKHCANYVPLEWDARYNGIDNWLLYRQQHILNKNFKEDYKNGI